MTAPEVQSTHYWPHIKRLEEADRHLYIYVTDVTAIIVPKAAFHSPGHLDEFTAELRKRIGKEPLPD